MRRFVYGLFSVLALAGCARTTGEIRMIGTEADFITKAGFAEEVTANWFTNNIYRKDKPAVFSPDSPQVVWFMVFQNAAFLGDTEFRAKWISPDGNVFTEQTFGQIPGNWNHAITSLPVRGTSAAQLKGRWSIEVYYKNNLIAKRSFRIE